MNEYSISKVQSKFISGVYGWMALGLTLTGLTALYTASSPALLGLIFAKSWTPWLLFGAQFGLVVFLTGAINSISSTTAKLCFFAYSMLTGLTLSSIFFVYTFASIATVFFICSAMFACMALYGHYTQTDLTRMGSFLNMTLIGLAISLLVNMYFQNSGFDYLLSIIGVIVFTLLTAYDTQKIKELASHVYSDEDMTKLSIYGALDLYLDFINLFIYLLRLMGRRKE